MGIDGVSFDKEGNVLIRYTADTTQIAGELEKLKSSMDVATLQPAEWAKSWNESINATTKKLGELNQAFEGLHKIIDFGKDLFSDYANRIRLTTASAGADIERLSKSAGGLKDEMELLQFAAKASNAQFHVSAVQMNEVQEAMLELTRRGFDAETVNTRLTDAIVGLKTKGFDKLGLSVQAASDDAGKFKAIMETIHGVAQEGEKRLGNEAEGVQSVGVEFKNAVDHIKDAIAELVVAMKPLLDVAASLVDKIATVAKGAFGKGGALGAVKGSFGMLVNGNKSASAQSFGAQYDLKYDATSDSYYNSNLYDTAVASGYKGTEEDFTRERQANIDALATKKRTFDDAIKAQVKQWGSFIENAGEDTVKMVNAFGTMLEKGEREAFEAAQKKAIERAKSIREEIDKAADKMADELLVRIQADVGGINSESYGQQGFFAKPNIGQRGLGGNVTLSAMDYGAYGSDANTRSFGTVAPVTSNADQAKELARSYAPGGAVAKNMDQAYNMWQKRSGASFLEETFGKVGEFDLYKKAFDGLTSATTSAFHAWVTGSESLGNAFKKSVATALEAMGAQMLIESLKHAAYAIGSVAFYDYAGAAAHTAAAAEFAAGALAAGVAARALGGGGSSAASSGGAGSGAAQTYSAPAGATGQGQNPIIVYGDSFADDSPYMKQIKAQKLVNTALGKTSAGSSS